MGLRRSNFIITVSFRPVRPLNRLRLSGGQPRFIFSAPSSVVEDVRE
jgi:hypothetical protein